jgi:membrane fusion protein, heavy metal efflux system
MTPRMAVLLCAGFALVISCRRAGEAQAAGEPVVEPRVDGDRLILGAESPQRAALQVVAAEPAAAETLHLAGRLVWDEDVTVRIFSPFAGRVVSVAVDAGHRVVPNDVLATLAAPDFGQAQADAQRAATDLALAERTLARQRDLLAHGVVAQKDVDAAEADLARARAEQQRAEARRAVYGGDSTAVNGEFPLRTPLGGRVVERNLTPGQEVRPDQMLANDPALVRPLFIVTDPARMWMMIDLPEQDVANLTIGAPLQIHTRAWPDRVFHGRVALVGNEVDPATRTVKVRATVPNPDDLLKAEMLGDVDVVRGEARQIGVPASAIVFADDAHVVFVEEAPGRFRRTVVRVGPEQHGIVPVRSGLSIGERVVTSGSLLVEQLFQQARGS